MFSKNIVRKTVMKVVDNLIKEGEKKFADGCKNIDENYLQELAALDMKRDSDKQKLLDSIVGDIAPKVL
jgi:hypothetical protein